MKTFLYRFGKELQERNLYENKEEFVNAVRQQTGNYYFPQDRDKALATKKECDLLLDRVFAPLLEDRIYTDIDAKSFCYYLEKTVKENSLSHATEWIKENNDRYAQTKYKDIIVEILEEE